MDVCMTREQSDDLDAALDRFESRLRRKWSSIERRIAATRRKRLDGAASLSDIRRYHSDGTAIKLDLDYYDAMPPSRRLTRRLTLG